MSPRLPRLAALGGALGLILFATAGSAFGSDSFQECLDQSVNHDGVPPTCTETNGSWNPTWPDEAGSGLGIPGWFVLVVIVFVVLAIGSAVWRVSTARKLAASSGMDPGLATSVALLTEDGLDATYLAANLRGQAPASAAAPASPPSAAARLAELRGLLDAGLVTQAEYDERRRAIIDAV
ncbi:MAG TPA: SHOCT domain-containing protein [Marmoricola sp.]